MKRLWKIIKGIGANLPFFLILGAAFYAGFYLDDKESMHFFVILGGFYILFREMYELREVLKNAMTNESEGRHHVRGSMHGSDSPEDQGERPEPA